MFGLFKSGQRRSRVHSLVGGIEIVIPTRTMAFTTIFLGFWLCGWAVGEVFAISEVLKGTRQVFLYFWLGGWTCGGALALSTFLWGLFGRERVMATRDQLGLVHECGPWRRVQQFDPKEIRALRVVDAPSSFGNRRSLAVMPLWEMGAVR